MHIDQATFVKIVDLLTSDKELDYKAIVLHILKTNPHAFVSAVDALTQPVQPVDTGKPAPLGELLRRCLDRDQPVKPTSAKMAEITESVAEDILQPLISHHDKVATIKKLREATGWGLKEAKDVIDAVQSGIYMHLTGDMYHMYKLLRQAADGAADIGC